MTPVALERQILLLGATGQLGWELQRALATLGTVIAPTRGNCDLSDLAKLIPSLSAIAPSLIVNAAAYTSVDQAEDDQSTVRLVNGVAPGLLADFARSNAIPLVHFSTDYVFDGRKRARSDGVPQAYDELDLPAPVNVYGASKLQGEEVVRAAGCAHLIFRTAWVYGNRGRNFLNTILKLSSERDHLRVVDDQIGNPTWVRLLADATAQILAMTWAKSGLEGVAKVSGTYHLAASGTTSWFGFAQTILMFRNNDARSRRPVIPITSAEHPTRAPRPAFSALDCGKAARVFGVMLPDWRKGLSLCLSERPA